MNIIKKACCPECNHKNECNQKSCYMVRKTFVEFNLTSHIVKCNNMILEKNLPEQSLLQNDNEPKNILQYDLITENGELIAILWKDSVGRWFWTKMAYDELETINLHANKKNYNEVVNKFIDKVKEWLNMNELNLVDIINEID